MGDKHGNPKKIENFASVVGAFTSHYGKNDDQTTVTEAERKKRQEKAAEVADSYYNFASAAYETGWSTHFHYTPFPPSFPPSDSTIATALAFYEHRLAFLMNLKPNMKVLDVGCGIGGPAREIAKFVGCEIVGVSINQAQIDRAIYLTALEGLQGKCTFVRGDFLDLPFAPSSFDAAYAIEATVHSPSLLRVYSNIARVLKPGAIFGVSEWVLTPKYNPQNPKHVGIRNRLERGNALSNLHTSELAREAMKGAGFEVEYEEDFAGHFEYVKKLVDDNVGAKAASKAEKGMRRRKRVSSNMEGQEPTTTAGQDSPPFEHQSPVLVPFKSSSSSSASSSDLRPAPSSLTPLPSPLPIPPTVYRHWSFPFVPGSTSLATTWTDWWTCFKMTKFARRVCYAMVFVGEKAGLWDKGVTDAMVTLAYCVDSTAEAAREEIFSPCWWFIGRKVGDIEDEDGGRNAESDRDAQLPDNSGGDGTGHAREDLSVFMY